MKKTSSSRASLAQIELGALLRELRLAKGWSQGQAAKKIGRPQTYVSDLELSLRIARLLEVRELVLAYGVPFSTFARLLDPRIERARRGLSTAPQQSTKASATKSTRKKPSKRRTERTKRRKT
jgi:transcriptional regulator with XRE-family HTH domain